MTIQKDRRISGRKRWLDASLKLTMGRLTSFTGSVKDFMVRKFTTAAEKRISRRRKAVRLKLYRNIDELPLSVFVGVLCDKRYEMLYRVGVPAKGESMFVEEAFSELYAEYAERVVGNEKGVYENMKRIALSLAAVRILEASILLAMYNKIDDGTVKLLRKYGVRIGNDVEMNVTVLSSLLHKAVRKYQEAAEKYKEQMSKDSNQDREYFMTLLASMSSHFKFPITITGITVGDFCGMYNQMKLELKAAKRKQSRKSY